MLSGCSGRLRRKYPATKVELAGSHLVGFRFVGEVDVSVFRPFGYYPQDMPRTSP